MGCTNDHSGHDHGDGHDHGATHDRGHDDHADHDNHEDHEEGVIHLTKEQVATMEIELGDFVQVKVNDFIAATGTLGLPPNALTSVSAKSEGFIKGSNKYVEGSYVQKGTIMAHLENSDFIAHQQVYLETAADLIYAKQELKRHEELLAADAGILKKVQELTAAVNRQTATLNGYARQLSYLGISIDHLNPNSIIQQIPILAPMSGYITSIKMHNGMYVTPALELLEIVNENHLHLELDIFEKDIARVEKKQRISYSVPALGNEFYEGRVDVIGREFNLENKTVRIHGHLEKKQPKFIKDLFVEAKIWLDNQTVAALPEKAVIRDGSMDYIYFTKNKPTDDELEFTAVMVVTGARDGDYISVKTVDKIPEDAQIVTQGAYYVYAQSKVGELEHSH